MHAWEEERDSIKNQPASREETAAEEEGAQEGSKVWGRGRDRKALQQHEVSGQTDGKSWGQGEPGPEAEMGEEAGKGQEQMRAAGA
jgi:hypothetical protein